MTNRHCKPPTGYTSWLDWIRNPPPPTPELRALMKEYRANQAPSDPEALKAEIDSLRTQLAELTRALEKEREACARVADDQPFYPDTQVGLRQQWVKDQIAAAIRVRARAPAKDGE